MLPDPPPDQKPGLLAAETLAEALPNMAMTTRAVHADDFTSSHRAIAPPMHVAVNYRYARDPDHLVPMENKDVSTSILPRHLNGSGIDNENHSQMPLVTRTSTRDTPSQTQLDSRQSYRISSAAE